MFDFSTRQPDQVFTLLETIYRAFDEIANRYGVFKVCIDRVSFKSDALLLRANRF